MVAKPIEHRRREPAPGVFRLVLPLPFPGLDRVNAYLLTDPQGHTLVDCGIYFPEEDRDHGWDELVGALAACDVTVADVARLLITHPHIDHYGMAARFVEASGADLWMHEHSDAELEMLRDPDKTVARMREMLAGHVATEEEVDELTAYEDWRPFVSGLVEPTTSLSDGETFAAGDRAWTIVHTPGHSPAHVCVWSASDSILISGDHLLGAITPHIDFKKWEEEDPLGEFLGSLKRIESLDPKLVLPGHGRPFDEGAERARTIARHHDRRLGSILQVIRHEPRSAEEITQEIFGSTLLNFQKRLALGEALAHIAYLRRRGEVERIERDDGYLYVKAKRRHTSSDDDEDDD